MSPDWAVCEADILRLYINGSNTIQETIRYIQGQHNIMISPKQFKSRYGGLKNLRTVEWKAVIRELEKRRAAGKESNVYLFNRQLEPERVNREVRRYLKAVVDSGPVMDSTSIDLGLETRGQHRIEIRTPSEPSIDGRLRLGFNEENHFMLTENELQDDEIIHPNTISVDEDSEPINGRIFCSEISPPGSHSNREQTTRPALEEFSVTGRLDYFTSVEAIAPFQSRHILPYRSPSSPFWRISPMLRPASCARSSHLNWPGVSNYLSKYLPDSFLSIQDAGILALDTNDHGLSIENICPNRSTIQWGRKGYLFSSLVHVNSILSQMEYGASYVEKIFSTNLHANNFQEFNMIFGNPGQAIFQQIFSIITYLGSNNLLGFNDMKNFMLWVNNQTDGIKQLAIHLQTSSLNSQGFTLALLRSIPSILKHQAYGGVLSPLNTPEILDFIQQLCKLHFPSFSDSTRGTMLHEAASYGQIDLVKLFVSCGARIDFLKKIASPALNGLEETPLCAAISTKHSNIAEYLIEAGSEVNLTVDCENGGQMTALTLAIKYNNIHIIGLLLDNGAEVKADQKIDNLSIWEFTMKRNPPTYEFLRDRLDAGRIPEFLDLIHAAEGGNNKLLRFIHQHNIFEAEILEYALYQSIKSRNIGAVNTLLHYGVNPNVPNVKRLGGDTLDNTSAALLAALYRDIDTDIIYLLLRAGSTLDDATILKKCCGFGDDVYDFVYLLADLRIKIDVWGPTALGLVAFRGHIYHCGFFLDIGCSINGYGENGLSALQSAAKGGSLITVQYLLNRGANVNLAASEIDGRTALQAAASAGHLDIVNCLIEAGADIKAAPAKENGITVLEALARAEALIEDSKSWEDQLESVFKILLALGAEVNRPNCSNGTVLHGLILTSRFSLLKLALQVGAQVEDRDPESHYYTPLQAAASLNRFDAIHLLLEYGADINADPGDELGRTALQAAVCVENPEYNIVAFLLLRGAKINAPPAKKAGVTALQGAASRGHLEIVKMLLQHDADINAAPSSSEGRTAIEAAAEHGRLDTVRLLLCAGARGHPLSHFASSIELANENGHTVITSILRDYEKAGEFLLDGVSDSFSPPSTGMILDDVGF